MNPIISSFIALEKAKANMHGVILDLSESKRVKYNNIECNGFFESTYLIDGKVSPFLATAIGKPLEEWLPTFAHETSHMDQWLENSSYWMASDDFEILDNWLNGQDYELSEVEEFIKKVIVLEADCELRTMEKIKKYNLPIDLQEYAKRANAYLLFYHWMFKNRKWYNKAPYEIESIVKSMPIYMKEPNDYLIPLSIQQLELFELCR